jgi:pimeloyl-ACP methyl ester carboxylesterase
MAFVETRDGQALFYNDVGAGKPVVLIHGWPFNSDMWEYQTTVLAAQGLRCISYDRRGFGKSSQPWTGYDYDTFADDLADLLDKLELNGVTLVGFSMGGGEIARYLSRHGPARVAKTVLVSCVTPFLLKTDDHPEGVDGGNFDQMVEGLEKDRPQFLTKFAPDFYGNSLLDQKASPGILQWSLMMAMIASPKATLDCVRAFSETDFRPDMTAFTMPTLVIHGTADKTVPIDVAGKAAAAAIPGSTFIAYEGEPHGLFFTSKDRLNADLLDFI